MIRWFIVNFTGSWWGKAGPVSSSSSKQMTSSPCTGSIRLSFPIRTHHCHLAMERGDAWEGFWGAGESVLLLCRAARSNVALWLTVKLIEIIVCLSECSSVTATHSFPNKITKWHGLWVWQYSLYLLLDFQAENNKLVWMRIRKLFEVFFHAYKSLIAVVCYLHCLAEQDYS